MSYIIINIIIIISIYSPDLQNNDRGINLEQTLRDCYDFL